MNDNDSITKEESKGINRRTVMTGAAWSLPVIALAASTPLAAASIANSSIGWVGRNANLLSLGVLNGSGTVTAGVGISVPLNVVVTNGSGAIDGPLTGSVAISHASGLTIPVGVGNVYLRGFGTATIPGATLGARTITPRRIYDGALVDLYVYDTTQTFTIDTPSIASGGTLTLGAITYGVTTRQGSLLNVDVAVAYNVVVSVYSGPTLVGTAIQQILVPVGAGIL